MKIVKTIEKKVLEIDEVSDSQIIVGIHVGRPIIGIRSDFNNPDSFELHIVDSNLSKGNKYGYLGKRRHVLGQVLDDPETKIHAFDDWKEAFQWLIDNG